MSDYEDNYGNEDGYGDEDYGYGEEDGYEYYESEQRFDVGYHHMEQLGMPAESWQALNTVIEGSSELARDQQRMIVDDKTQFHITITDFLKQDEIKNLFTPNDTHKIQSIVEKLSFLKRRNVIAYVLGYYMNENPKQNLIHKLTLLINKLNLENVDTFEIIKYSKMWKHKLYEQN